MSETDEALKIWEALQPMIDHEIEEKTKSCVRSKKMEVTSAPDGSVIGVKEPYGYEVRIPYSSALTDVEVGETVWVWYFFNNASTMIAMTKGDGQMNDFYTRFEETDQTIEDINQSIEDLDAAIQAIPTETITIRAYDSAVYNVDYDNPGYINFNHDITGYNMISKTVCLIREIVASGVRNSMEASITKATMNSTTTTQALVTNNSSNTKPIQVRLILFLQKIPEENTSGGNTGDNTGGSSSGGSSSGGSSSGGSSSGGSSSGGISSGGSSSGGSSSGGSSSGGTSNP